MSEKISFEEYLRRKQERKTFYNTVAAILLVFAVISLFVTQNDAEALVSAFVSVCCLWYLVIILAFLKIRELKDADDNRKVDHEKRD